MRSDHDRDPTLFGKRPGTEQMARGGRSRLPVGAILGGFLALLVILAVILFDRASRGAGGGGHGQTIGTGLLFLPGV